jgi:hypothetical protein
LRRQDAIRLPLLTKYRSPAWLLCSPMRCANRCQQATAPCSRCAAMICFVHSSSAKHWPPRSIVEAPCCWGSSSTEVISSMAARLQPRIYLQELYDDPPLPCDPQADHLDLQPAPSSSSPSSSRHHRAGGGPFSGETSTLMCQALE